MNNIDLTIIKESFLVFIDSRNGIINNPGLNSDVKFEFPGSLYFNNDDYIQITFSLNNFICPNSIYNINEYNNGLSLFYNGITNNLIIPSGNYNLITFTNYLSSVLPSHFNITFSTITNKITFNNSLYDFIINPSSIYEVIGLDENVIYSSNNKIFTCPYCCNFNGSQNLNITIENINTNNLDSFTKTQTNIIHSIPIDLTSSTIKFIKGNDHEIPLKINYLDYIHINLIDDKNNLINLNGKHFNLTIEFSVLKCIDLFKYTFDEIVNEN